MTTVHQIVRFLDTLAPGELAEDWDNTGLSVGSRNAPVTKVLVALDPFENVAQEAIAMGAEMIVTHHPLLFHPLSEITDESAVGRTATLLLKNNISAWSGHTNLDIAPGGVNDTLATLLGLSDIQTIGEEKLLRCGNAPEQPLEDFLTHVKAKLGTPVLRYADGGKPVSRVAVGGGSCAGEMELAIAAGCDTFVTADVKYNNFWDARDQKLTIIDAGHFYTENPICAVLAEKLAAAFPEVQVCLSKCHRDCMKFF